MLDFERALVGALTTARDAPVRQGVEEFVERTLSDMPELLRAGVAVQSVALAVAARVAGATPSAAAPAESRRLVASLAGSPLAPIRQYVRLFRSLVLFAEQELEPEAAA